MEGFPELIEAYPGGAIARHGGHKVIFAENFASEVVVDMETRDGKRLQSRVLGLSYLDSASGKSVLLAEATNSIGQIINTNQILYSDAFSGGLKADVRFTYTKAVLEQDVIWIKRPPTPESFGLDSKTTRLQVLTEFLSPPPPVLKTRATPLEAGGIEDQMLDFGVMQMGQGKAFTIGLEGAIPEEVPVAKQWTVIEGRTILVEGVSVAGIARQLEALPVKKRTASFWRKPARQIASLKLLLPARMVMPRVKREMQLANLSTPLRGVVLDYSLLASAPDVTLKADTTYYVSGLVNLSGTTTIEGGTVVKFANSSSAKISVGGNGLVCQTGPYRPAIFTSKFDSTVGETVATGTPVNTGATYLEVSAGGTNALKYLRFLYAGTALAQSYAPRPIWHSQFLLCTFAIKDNPLASSGTQNLHNVLLAQCAVAVNGVSGTVSVQGEHVTADQITQFWIGPGQPANALTNSILTAIGNMGATFNLDHSYSGSSAGMFVNNGTKGNYYLAAAPYKGTGNPNINLVLLADLKQKTTYPPTVQTTPFPSNTTLGRNPAVLRDTNCNPDRGYHYDALDYCWAGLNINGTLTMNGGVAVGIHGPYGFQSGTLVSVGTPNTHNQIALYSAVQEQPVAWGATASATYLLNSWSSGTRFRFTDISLAGSAGFCSTTAASSLEMRDGSLHAAKLNITGGNNNGTLGFTNNIIERCDFVLLGCYGPYFANFYNNLFLNNGNLGLGHACSGSILQNFAVKNNLFVRGSFTYGAGTPQIANNGYYNTAVTSYGTAPKIITTLDFQPGPLGGYYYPNYLITSGDLYTLIDAGNGTSASLGLDTYTVRADQSPDNTDPVDIGYHYSPVYAPSAIGGPAQTCRNTLVNITLDGFDPNGFPLTYTVVANPAHGTLTGCGQNWTYTPATSICGPDSFTFKVNNGFLDSDPMQPGVVTINVGDPNPVANCQDVMTGINTPVTFILSGSGNTCGESLTFTLVPANPPANGTFSAITPNDPTSALVTYTPGSSTFEGSDDYLVTASDCGFSSSQAALTINVVPGPTLTTDCRQHHIVLRWAVPDWLVNQYGDSFFYDFRIYRCETTSGSCTPTVLYATVTDSSARSYVDFAVEQAKTYCYRVSFRHQDNCATAVVYESPFSTTSCNQLCSQPAVLISGNTAAAGGGPIQTYDFTDGILVNLFVPEGATVNHANGRGIAIHGTEIFYTELSFLNGPSDAIHVAAYGTEGSGGTVDDRTILNPRPSVGIQDLAFHNNTLYALTGYPSEPLQVFKLDPATGAVIGGAISVQICASCASANSDGFTVLPNGNFLINDEDASPIYREYDGTTGNRIPPPAGLEINLTAFTFPSGTGVATAPDGQSLYFIAGIGGGQTLVQTDLTGHLIGSRAINSYNIEDISVVIP